MKILNLYAGLGGNRLNWPRNAEVVSVERDKEIAERYRKIFPNDTVVVGDAHNYLIDHIEEDWDFVWGSPPCPTHSRCNQFTKATSGYKYPDMQLWQEILFLEKNAKFKWVIENVITYYKPLRPPTIFLVDI